MKILFMILTLSFLSGCSGWTIWPREKTVSEVEREKQQQDDAIREYEYKNAIKKSSLP